MFRGFSLAPEACFWFQAGPPFQRIENSFLVTGSSVSDLVSVEMNGNTHPIVTGRSIRELIPHVFVQDYHQQQDTVYSTCSSDDNLSSFTSSVSWMCWGVVT